MSCGPEFAYGNLGSSQSSPLSTHQAARRKTSSTTSLDHDFSSRPHIPVAPKKKSSRFAPYRNGEERKRRWNRKEKLDPARAMDDFVPFLRLEMREASGSWMFMTRITAECSPFLLIKLHTGSPQFSSF